MDTKCAWDRLETLWVGWSTEVRSPVNVAGSARNPAPIDSGQRPRPEPTVTRSDPASGRAGGLISPANGGPVCQATEMAAAMRLVSVPESEKGRRRPPLLAAGPRHGVDFSHAWSFLTPAVLVADRPAGLPGGSGVGRTGMVFLSERSFR